MAGMRIGIPRQTAPGERRVALTPDVVGKLIERGHVVVVETDAGRRAGFIDDEYRAKGAEVGTAADAWSADFVATVSLDDPLPDLAPSSVLLGLLRPFDEPERMVRLAETGATIFAFEAVPRTTRAQTVDALSSQATAAGYQAALEGAAATDRFLPMLTTAAGTIPPGRVVVLGAGVAGLQAIATAKRLGAIVSAFDVRAAAAEQEESLGASFIDLEVERQDETQTGGYAREVAEDTQARIMDGLAPHIAQADVVITTAAIPGRPAPRLISAEMVEGMRSGSVIVDLAASTGGNCELTRPGETVDHGGVTIIGDTDLVSRVAHDASRMLAKNVASFLDLVTDDEGGLSLDFDDDIVAAACIARDGQIIHPRLKES